MELVNSEEPPGYFYSGHEDGPDFDTGAQPARRPADAAVYPSALHAAEERLAHCLRLLMTGAVQTDQVSSKRRADAVAFRPT